MHARLPFSQLNSILQSCVQWVKLKRITDMSVAVCSAGGHRIRWWSIMDVSKMEGSGVRVFD